MRVPLILLKRCLAKAFVLLAVAAMLTGAPRPAAAEDWPQRPVTLLISFASASMIDFVGRSLANDLSEAIGQPVVVETKSGGGGVVASLFVAKAPLDGYTLLLTGGGPAALRPLMDNSVGYDPVADFTPIILNRRDAQRAAGKSQPRRQNGQGSGRLCQVERRQD